MVVFNIKYNIKYHVMQLLVIASVGPSGGMKEMRIF